ncbi:very short patch repair endonuclease [Rhizobium sp. DKSPLA3]|uniref:Very short patch repair endonuclease n=1 Tax=Rhizobium quercicola TaxID=2901226 RepID=A0A9X1NXS4_9HYPH|nr:very short patch repair endonuclease [Rhizobium quercicola]MCD7111839.1 very short patch repair endonuclease [Rhizobium quercicola]
MADIVTPEVRSRMMSGIRGRDTKPEMILRRGLHAMGFRFRLHDRRLPGKPDMVLPRYRSVIFAHGCFWHGHDCHLFRLPATRTEFWEDKIGKNKARDRDAVLQLLTSGWRVATVWECAMRGRGRLASDSIETSLANWLRGEGKELELSGYRCD